MKCKILLDVKQVDISKAVPTMCMKIHGEVNTTTYQKKRTKDNKWKSLSLCKKYGFITLGVFIVLVQ